MSNELKFLSYWKKKEKIDFSTFATKLRFCSIFPDRLS